MRAQRLFSEGFRALGANKVRTFLMALGTTVGIGALTVILCISSGTDKKIKSEVKRFGARAIIILPGHGRMSRAVGGTSADVQLKLADTEAIANQIEGLEGLTSVSAKFGQSIKFETAQTDSGVEGVEAVWHRIWEWPVMMGEPITEDDVDRMARVCVLGTTIKRELFGETDPIGQYVYIGNARLRVKGVLESRGTTSSAHDRDRRVLVPISTAMRRLFNQKHLSLIGIKMKEGYDLDRTSEAIIELLNQRHHIDGAIDQYFTAFSTSTLVKRFKKISLTVSKLLYALTGLSLIVGGIVLMNIMLISVAERKAEIGLRRALGASHGDIFTQFLAESVGVNLIGLAFGWVAGFLCVLIIGRFTQIPVAFAAVTFLLGGAFSVMVGLIFGIQPARRAANLDPVEALR